MKSTAKTGLCASAVFAIVAVVCPAAPAAAQWPDRLARLPAGEEEAAIGPAAEARGAGDAELAPVLFDLPPLADAEIAEFTPEEDAGLVLWRPFRFWKRSFELGLSGTDGNSQTMSLRFGTDWQRETDFSKQKFDLTYLTKENEGIKAARNLQGAARSDWPLKSTPWSYYVRGTAEYDEFKAFDLRLAFDTGLAFDFIKTERTSLQGRFGGGMSHELGGPEEGSTPELAYSLELTHKFSERQKISGSVDYFPDVSDYPEYRLNSKASYEVLVDPDWGMSLKLSAVNRYDSTPGGRKPNDLDYSALLMWSF